MSTAEQRVVVFGTYDDGAHPRVRVLREALVAAGYDVVICNSPIAVPTSARVEAVSKPWKLLPIGLKVAASWGRLIQARRRLPPVDAVLVGYLGVADVHLARALFRSTPILLDQMAPVSGTALDRNLPFARILKAVDTAAARAADVVLVDTEQHRGEDNGRVRIEVVPVGAPAAFFVREGRSRDNDQLRIVFFGLYTPLQGTQTIARAIAHLADRDDIRWTMIGTGQDLAVAQGIVGENEKVDWIDWVEPSNLPKIVAEHDVCLGIFGTTGKSRRVVPNKVYQGAAAGCAVVTSDTPPQRSMLGEAALYVPPGDDRALEAVLARLADHRSLLAQYRSSARELADRDFTPSAIAARLRSIVDDSTRAR